MFARVVRVFNSDVPVLPVRRGSVDSQVTPEFDKRAEAQVLPPWAIAYAVADALGRDRAEFLDTISKIARDGK